MDGQRTSTSWRRFWERGGGWRALLLAGVYYGLYELIGYLLSLFGGDSPGALRGEQMPAPDIFLSVALPLLLSSVLLVLFARSLGRLRDLPASAEQPFDDGSIRGAAFGGCHTAHMRRVSRAAARSRPSARGWRGRSPTARSPVPRELKRGRSSGLA